MTETTVATRLNKNPSVRRATSSTASIKTIGTALSLSPMCVSSVQTAAATAKMPSVMPASQSSCRLLCRLGIIISLKLPHHLERDVGIRAASSCRTSFQVVLL